MSNAIQLYTPGGYYRWALAHVGPAHYHRVEAYIKDAHRLTVAAVTLRDTPAWTDAHRRQLTNIINQLRNPHLTERREMLDQRRHLEDREATYQKARVAFLSAFTGLHRHRSRLTFDQRKMIATLSGWGSHPWSIPTQDLINHLHKGHHPCVPNIPRTIAYHDHPGPVANADAPAHPTPSTTPTPARTTSASSATSTSAPTPPAPAAASSSAPATHAKDE